MLRWQDRLRNFGRMILLILLFLIVAAIAEQVGPLRAMEDYLLEHPSFRQTLTAIMIILSIAGLLLLVGAQLVIRVGDEEALPGGQISSSFSDEATLQEVKEAWRSGDWRTSQRWQRFFLMFAGASLMVIGLFGLPVIIAPPSMKLLFGGALVYAIGRTAWAFWRA